MRAVWTHQVYEARQGCGEDRIKVVELKDRVVVIVADGAGGMSKGAAAAEFLCSALYAISTVSWVNWLTEADRLMAASPSCGLAAAVVAEIGNDGFITGASVGDCEARVFGNGILNDGQHQKPLLGSGEAVAVPFKGQLPADSTLVLGTDGLWKYAKNIHVAAATRPLDVAAKMLVDSTRLKSGALQDDVAVFVYSQ